MAFDASGIRTKVLERKVATSEGVRLEDADVVVTGGRGLGGPENFDVIEELAQLLGGAVGASRAVADLGWRPVAEQVGLTGKVVSPTLYIAVAVSGASQHMAGCSGSKNIVAINKDADANIFKAARFGIVGDFKNVMPALIEAVKKVQGRRLRPACRHRSWQGRTGVRSWCSGAAVAGGRPRAIGRYPSAVDLELAFTGDIVERQELLNGAETATLEGATADGAWTLSAVVTWNIGLEANTGEGDITLAARGRRGDLRHARKRRRRRGRRSR